MVFTTLKFLVFFCIVFFAYYIVPKKIQWIVLLVASIYFYLCASVKYVIYVILATLITYLGALVIDRYVKNQQYFLKKYKDTLPKENKKIYKKRIEEKKKKAVIITIIATLSMLIVMKYADFFFQNISMILNIFKIDFSAPVWNFVLPLGISFYTFMSIGYVIDVYREEYEAERNFFKYFLYISYFPHILQGPMDKYSELSNDLFCGKTFNYNDAVIGMYRIVVGIIKKMVVADKLAPVITAVTTNVQDYYGINILIAIVLYAIQLYADFSGYMDIAIGCSKMLGIKIAENFDAPYFSKSIAEYWRRWHISLGAWFRDYVYYPILRGKNSEKIRKFFKNKNNKFLANNMPTVFALSILWILIGFWHGSTWAFILYGMYHGSIIIISTLLAPLYDKFYKKFPNLVKTKIYSAFQIVRTFGLVLIGYFLFCVGNLSTSIQMFGNMFLINANGKNIVDLLSRDTGMGVILGTIIILILDYFIIKKIDIYEKLRTSKLPVRWVVYCIGLYIIFLFAPGGTTQEFLYFQF